MKIKDIKTFEKNNNLGINVFGYNEDQQDKLKTNIIPMHAFENT